MKNLLFWNGSAGKARQVEQLRAALATHSLDWIELREQVNLLETVVAAAATGCQTVIAAGGDGTVNAMVNALMQIDASRRPSLGIIPLGTANDFAGTLAIPDEVASAASLIFQTDPTPIDVVRIRNDAGSGYERYFANVAAGGNCVRVSEELDDELKARWGAFSYVRGAVSVLADMKSYRIVAEIDGQKLNPMDSWAVLVSNGRTNAGRIEVAPLASPTDGLLDVIIIKDGSLVDMVEIVAGNLTGNFLECDQVVFRQAKKLCLQSDPGMRFTLDGEVIDAEPVEFEVVPAAIKMYMGVDAPRNDSVAPQWSNPLSQQPRIPEALEHRIL